MPAVRARQQRGEPDGRLIGIGFAAFAEQTAHGAAEFVSRGASIMPGFESCTARILTDGAVVLMVGIQSHGQGLETALSQIAAEELGIDPARISVRHGDTEMHRLRLWHLRLAQHGDGGRCGGAREPHAARQARTGSARISCNAIRPRCAAPRAWCVGRRAR